MKELLLEEHYSFCSTQVNAPEEIKGVLLRFGDLIDQADLNEEAGGKEDEPHVTILYGIKSVAGLQAIQSNIEKIRKAIPVINVKLGKVSSFQNDEFDVLKIDVESKELKALHAYFKSITEWESDFPDYKPHLTIAYLKAGTQAKYAGDDRFEGKTFSVNQFLFCNNNGEKTPITLSKQIKEEVAMNYKEFFIKEGKYAHNTRGRNLSNVKVYSVFANKALQMFPRSVSVGRDDQGQPTEGLLGDFKEAFAAKDKRQVVEILDHLEKLVKPTFEYEFTKIYKPAFLRAVSVWK